MSVRPASSQVHEEESSISWITTIMLIALNVLGVENGDIKTMDANL
jgi:hypothetical protein